MNEFEVKLSGFQEVDEIDKNKITENCSKFYVKHNKKLKNIEFIEIYLKDYQKEGNRKKFSVRSTLGFSGTSLSSKAFDWNLAKAVDSSLKKLESEIKRNFLGKISEKNKNEIRRNKKRLST